MSPTGGYAREHASKQTLLLIPCHEAFHTQGGGELTNEPAPAYPGTIMIRTRGAFHGNHRQQHTTLTGFPNTWWLPGAPHT